MRFAYADPPYPGKSKRYYGNHPDYAGEVDHVELINRLCRDYPDGWALSTSAAAVREVLIMCPSDVRLGIWHSTSSMFPGARADRWWNVWEPVIVRGGRRLQSEAPAVADLLTCGRPSEGFTGAKPGLFSRWVFQMLGAQLGDDLDDMFPGSGAVARAWEAYLREPQLPVREGMGTARLSKGEEQRRMAKRGLISPMF